MYDFSDILVTQAPENKVNVYNPTSYSLIGQGAQGAVFKISQSHCVKIYTSNALADLEYSSYQAAKHSFVVPLIYEKGPNYIIMEYLPGPALDNYLQETGKLPKWVTTEIIYLLKKMKQFHFSRIDFAL